MQVQGQVRSGGIRPFPAIKALCTCAGMWPLFMPPSLHRWSLNSCCSPLVTPSNPDRGHSAGLPAFALASSCLHPSPTHTVHPPPSSQCLPQSRSHAALHGNLLALPPLCPFPGLTGPPPWLVAPSFPHILTSPAPPTLASYLVSGPFWKPLVLSGTSPDCSLALLSHSEEALP